MTNGGKIMLSATLTWQASLVFAGAPVRTHTFDLNAALKPYGLSSTDVVSIHTSESFDSGRNWRSGAFAAGQALTRGALSISRPFTSDTVVEDALKITEAKIPQLTGGMYACHGGKCNEVPSQRTGVSNTVRIADQSLTVTVYGDLCRGGSGECAVFVPSWSLEKLRISTDGGMPTFPEVISAIDVGDRVLLVDADSGRVWFDLNAPKESVGRSLGSLKSATFVGEGQLALTYDHGGLLFDFAEDLLVLVGSDGAVYLKDGGIGAGRIDGLVEVTGSPRGGNLLALTSGWVVNQTSAWAFMLGHATGLRKTAELEPAARLDQASLNLAGNGFVATTLSFDETSATLTQLKSGVGEKPRFVPGGSFSLGELMRDRANLQLVQDKLYWRTATSWSVIGADGKATSTQSFAGATEVRFASGTADGLVQRATGTTCEWTRWRSGQTFEQDGTFELPCTAGVALDLANSLGVVAATSWTANKATVTTWYPVTADSP